MNKFLQIILILLQIRMTVVHNILCLLVFTLNVSGILTSIFPKTSARIKSNFTQNVSSGEERGETDVFAG